MEARLKNAQRTISLLSSMVDSGEQHSIESRATTLQALLDLETVIAEVKEQRESIDNLRERVTETWIGEDNPKNNIA